MSSKNTKIPQTLRELAEMFPNYVRDLADFKCEKEIGRGGFGVVWLGTDCKTNQKVAIKSLLSNKLSKNATKFYIREIHTMALLESMFVVDLVGFTIENPFAIITKYQQKGQLSKHIKKKVSNSIEKFSGTKLSMIALGLASALITFEEHNIVHRDLKSGNILVDDELIPKICDFGAARIYHKGDQMTNKIGTLHFMAPENVYSKNYDNKVDVYSFGLVLYEMAEQKSPFLDVRKDQILQLLPQNKLHLNFDKASKELKSLIKQCTDFDPKKRPTPKELFDIFSSGKISFPGTNKKKISKFVDIILKNDEKKRKENKKLPPCYVNMETIIQKLDIFEQNPSNQDDNDKVADEDDFKIIEDTTVANYEFIFNQKLTSLNPEDYNDFVTSILKALMTHPPENIIISIYNSILEKIKKDQDFMTSLKHKLFYQELDLSTPEIRNMAIQIFGNLFRLRPSLVQGPLANSISALIEHDPESMIIQFGHYVNQLPPINDAIPVVFIFLEKSEIILNSKASIMFITILYNLIITYRAFRNQAIEPISEVLMNACKSEDLELARTALWATANLLPDENFAIDFEALIEIAKKEKVRNHLKSILLRINYYPPLPRIAALLISFSTYSTKCFLGLLKFCQSSRQNSEIVVNYIDNWAEKGLPTIGNTFKLFLVLFTDPHLRSYISDLPIYPSILSNFINIHESSGGKLIPSHTEIVIYEYIPSIIKRSNFGIELIRKFEEAGFWKKYFGIAIETDNEIILNSSLLMADIISTIQYVSDFDEYIPKISKILKNYQSLVVSAITVLVRMSFLERARKRLLNFKEYFKKLSNNPNYHQYANTFLKNLNLQK